MIFFTFLRFTKHICRKKYAPTAVERIYSREKNSESTATFGTQANLYSVLPTKQ